MSLFWLKKNLQSRHSLLFFSFCNMHFPCMFKNPKVFFLGQAAPVCLPCQLQLPCPRFKGELRFCFLGCDGSWSSLRPPCLPQKGLGLGGRAMVVPSGVSTAHRPPSTLSP